MVSHTFLVFDDLESFEEYRAGALQTVLRLDFDNVFLMGDDLLNWDSGRKTTGPLS